MLENAIKECRGGVKINIEVTPGAKKSEIGYDEWRKSISIKVKVVAKKGKANREIIKKFKEIFDAEVEIVSGHKVSKKVLFIHDKTEEDVVTKLRELVEND